MDAADGRHVAGVVEWLFRCVLLDARLKPADQRSSLIRSFLSRSVAEMITGILW